jgi:hypothetical protein
MPNTPKFDPSGQGLDTSAAMRCPEAEPFFPAYLDGTLDKALIARLEAHLAACPDCADELKQIRLGKEWLQLLRAEDAAPDSPSAAPAGLFEKIMARTTGVALAPRLPANVVGTSAPKVDRSAPWRSVNMAAVRGNLRRTGVTDPRLLMTAAMAFFSISITMNVAGIRLNDLRPGNLRHTVTRTYTDTSAHVTRYYQNMRVVYELESRVREMRRAAEANDANRTSHQPHGKSQNTYPQGHLQAAPESNSRREGSTPESASTPDGVARRDKNGQQQKKADPEPEPLYSGDVLEAALNTDSIFSGNTPSLPERSSAEPQRSLA